MNRSPRLLETAFPTPTLIMKYSSFPRLVLSSLALILVLPQIRAGNAPITVNPVIKEISFSGDDNNPNNHTLKKDDDSKTFDAPHYKNYLTTDGVTPAPDPLTCNYPTAYTKYTIPKVEMKFGIDMEIPENQTVKVIVKADGSDGVNFGEQTITLQHGQKIYDYPLIEGSKWPDKIRFYGPTSPFTLTWKSKMENDTNFTDCGTTSHRIYLTAGTPLCNRGNRETLFYYACKKPDGMSENACTEDAVTQKIYESFSTTPLQMKRINHETGQLDGTVLYYYQDPPPPNPTGELLVDGTAACGGWARFFADVLNVHHFTSEITNLGYTNYGFGGWFVRGLPTTFERSVTGQGPGKSSNSWSVHTITKAYDNYYDPSYGIGPCGSKEAYEDAAVGAYYYNNDPPVIRNVTNPSEPSQLDYHPTAY